nr:MAG TPA: hypothetical protein [Caudoviricetes sp.]
MSLSVKLIIVYLLIVITLLFFYKTKVLIYNDMCKFLKLIYR